MYVREPQEAHARSAFSARREYPSSVTFPSAVLLTSAREIHECPDGKEGDPGSVCKEDWPHKWTEYTPHLP